MKIHFTNSKFLKPVRSAFQNLKMQVHKNFTIYLLLALGVSGKKKSENYAPDPQDDKPQDYTFSYAVNDVHTGDNKNQWEKKERDVVTGSYSVVEPDGSIRTVEYTADDKNGFKAVVKYSRPANEIQKNLLSPTKIQLDHIDVPSISADHVSSSQSTDATSTLEIQPIKTDFAILKNQYEDKPVIDKWSPIITKPRAFQTIYQQELPVLPVYSPVSYISTAASNNEHNLNIEKPTYTTSLLNKETINPGEKDLNFNQQYLYPVYYRDTRDSQKYQNTYFEPVTPSTRKQRSNKRLEVTYNSDPYISSSASSTTSGLKYTGDAGNQYKVMNPSHTANYLQDLSSFKPIQKIISNDASKTNLVESNLHPNQQTHFYPWYKYDETQKLHYANFRPVTSSDGTSQLLGTGYKSPYYENVATPGGGNYGTSVIPQYPIIRNNYYGQNQYSNNFPSLIINKQLGRHRQVNVLQSKFGRLHPRLSSNREFMYV